MPEEYERLESITIDILPGYEVLPGQPFGGFALNINVATFSHRDVKDISICVIIPFGEYEGGELCLHEPGLVIDLRPGDMVAFYSREITHFNLHFKGGRHSLVFHTDRELKTWKTVRNGRTVT